MLLFDLLNTVYIIASILASFNCFFLQVCGLWGRVLSTTRDGDFNAKSVGLPRASGPHRGGTVDIKDLPHRWGKTAGQPERAAANTVSKKVNWNAHPYKGFGRTEKPRCPI